MAQQHSPAHKHPDNTAMCALQSQHYLLHHKQQHSHSHSRGINMNRIHKLKSEGTIVSPTAHRLQHIPSFSAAACGGGGSDSINKYIIIDNGRTKTNRTKTNTNR
eukprot:257360_1